MGKPIIIADIEALQSEMFDARKGEITLKDKIDDIDTSLSTKLESPINQAQITLTTQATTTGKAVRYDEFSVKHNNDGTFKGVDQEDMNLTNQATANSKPIRYDEFTKRHNNDGTIKQINYKKSSIANPSATANAYGTAVTLTPLTNYTGIYPMAIDIVFGGTFGSETVTAQFTVTYSDSTTALITKTATATGTVSLTNSELMSLIKDGVYITQTSMQSKSTITSSAVTTTFNRAGIYL